MPALLMLGFFTTSIPAAEAEPVQPIWTREIKPVDAPPDRLTILGERHDGKFVPTSVLLPEPPTVPSSVSLPLEANLLPAFTFRGFGVEERAALSRTADSLQIRCGSGKRPAGAVLSAPGFHFPRDFRGRISLHGRATGKFLVSVTEPGREAKEFVPISGTPGHDAETQIPSGLWTDGQKPTDLVIICPDGPGELSLSAIVIAPETRRIKEPAGTWIWDVTRWFGKEDKLIAELHRLEIGEVFLQTQIANGEITGRAALVELIGKLSAAGIGVNTVEGDPQMASPSGRKVAVARTRLLAGLKAETGDALSSFQYDIEPYTLPDFTSDPAFWWNGWATTIGDLAAAAKAPVSVVVPFWLLDHPAAEQALSRARGNISRIVVMSYRTEAGDVERIAETWLDWGGRHGVPIAFALENGFVPTEYQHHYRRAERGQVLLDISGPNPRVLLFAEPMPGDKDHLAYSFDNESKIGSERISFLSDNDKLNRVRMRLHRNLSAWRAFNGLLVHEIIGE